MIPAKLVETVFQKYWALLIPVIVVPILAMALTREEPKYRSESTVWVSNPVNGESVSLGQNNPYLTPAQNRAQALNDLLATRAFRVDVGRTAGLGSDEEELARTMTNVSLWAGTRGANLLTVTAEVGDPQVAQELVGAVITEYNARASAEFERNVALAEDYYTQQLPLAEAELAKRQSALSLYLSQRPQAATAGSPESLDLDYRTLVERVDSQTKLIASLRDSLQAAQLRAASAPETQKAAFTVQDAPSLPVAPVAAGKTKQLGIPLAGVIFGLLIGSGYIYFAYRTDHTIRTPADLASLPVPLLGSVPELRPGPKWLAATPFGSILSWGKHDFARKTAASISTDGAATSAVQSEG